MSEILKGRYTAQIETPFVVFLIGLYVNRWRAVRHWLPTVLAMRPMLKHLAGADRGLLGHRTVWYWRGVEVIQYWRSFEELERFARDTQGPHWPAWRRFYQGVRDDGPVGIWHETFVIQPGGYETLYGNMPRFGLAAAGEAVPLTDRRRARKRMAESENG